MDAFLDEITGVLTWAISSVGSVVTAFFGTSGALKSLLPFIAIGLGFAVLAKGVGYIRSFVKI